MEVTEVTTQRSYIITPQMNLGVNEMDFLAACGNLQ